MSEGTDIWTNVGIGAFGFVAALYAYFSKKAPAPPVTAPAHVAEAIVAGVGVEIGNREQAERLIAETRRAADGVIRCAAALEVLADRKQAALDDKMDEVRDQQERLSELMHRLEETARRN